MRAAPDPALRGSEYLGLTKSNEFKCYPEIVPSNYRSYDQNLAERLWALSEKMTGFTYLF